MTSNKKKANKQSSKKTKESAQQESKTDATKLIQVANSKFELVVEPTVKDVIKAPKAGKPKKTGDACSFNSSGDRKSEGMTIGQLEKKMLKKFPAKTACEWDRTGLLVGDKSKAIQGIAVTLDPTIEAVRVAHKAGANLLVTHHPAFLWKINNFHPADSVAQADGALVYEAISSDVGLMNFHTALDVSNEGGKVLPGLLNLKIKCVLEPTDGLSQEESKLGFGRICALKPADKGLTLRELGARCTSVFRKSPKIYGDMGSKPKKIATTTGSAGGVEPDSLLDKAIKDGVDCLICGEIRYHDAIAVSQTGMSVIELGHDISELPLAAPLVSALRECGVEKSQIMLIDQSNNWNYIDSTRV